MEDTNYKGMSNSELKLALAQIDNEFEAKKNEILRLCDDLDKLNAKYENINNELNFRKNLYN